MKSIAKYLFLAALASMTLASCEKEKENEFLNPKGTPVQFTLTGDKTFDGSKANIKVTSDTPVPADVTVTLSLDAAESTVKAANVTFPNLTIAAGQTEASGKIELDPAGLEADKTFKVVVKGTVSGVELGQKVSLKYTTDPAPIPEPATWLLPIRSTCASTTATSPATWAVTCGRVPVTTRTWTSGSCRTALRT